MNAPEALRSIGHDWLSYIQEKVKVEFDNANQTPVHFTHGRVHRLVHEVLGRFRLWDNGGLHGFLVKADDGEVYFLYFHRNETGRGITEGYWVLGFRILSDKELMAFYRDDRKMLVNMTVKRVVEFHGHLCPELAIGMKACAYAQELLSTGAEPVGRISVIAENCTSALDAFQVLLGATLGNQCLRVLDFGKHNYTFAARNLDKGFTLRLRAQSYGDEPEYANLEKKISLNQITLDEVVRFQQLLDVRASKLISARSENLFEVLEACSAAQTVEAPTAYLACSGCGQQVIAERVIEVQGRPYCVIQKAVRESKFLSPLMGRG